MNPDRRIFIRKLAGSTAGIIFSGAYFGNLLAGSPQKTTNIPYQKDIQLGTFPFFKYLQQYNFGDFIPKDQGGKFIQMELIGTEADEIIVQKIRGGLFEEVYGNPVCWGSLEKTELEKSVWLNRFYYTPSFARMFYLTKNRSYLEDMMRIIRKWIIENPRLGNSHNYKYNWFDMQVAWRSVHLSWSYFLCEEEMNTDDKELIFNTLEEHAEVLLSGFGKQPLNEFNHQAHGGLAMLYLGILFPSFKNAVKLKENGLKIISHHIKTAFYSDGGNVEQMFGYYPFETHIFRDTLLLCTNNNVVVPDGLLPLLEKMNCFLSTVMQPDGTMPSVNDSYEMTAIPMITILNEILGRDYLPSIKSEYFRETQIGIIRSADSDQSWYLLANPAKSIGAHAHAGRLGFSLWYKDQPLLIDSGCCNYDNPLLIEWYRTSKAHNTVLIDNKSDEETSSSKLWAPKRLTKNKIADWIDEDSFTFCRMFSPKTEAANSSVNWSRSLIIVKQKFIVLHDYFSSKEEHDYEVLFHFPPVEISTENKRIWIHGKNQVGVFPANEKQIDSLIISEGLISKNGNNIPAPMAKFKFHAKGSVHSVIIFIPETNMSSRIKIKQKDTPNGTGIMISHKNETTFLLMRNPESDELNVFGHNTRKLFEVI